MNNTSVFKFEAYETRHIVSMREIKVITQLSRENANGRMVSYPEYFVRYYRQSYATSNESGKTFEFIAFYCVKSLLMEQVRSTVDSTVPTNYSLYCVIGRRDINDNKYDIVCFKHRGTEESYPGATLNKIATDNDLDVESCCLFLLSNDVRIVDAACDNKYTFTYESNSHAGVSTTGEPLPGEIYKIVLKEIKKEEDDGSDTNAQI
jgi:hypothetical protein